MTRKNPISMVRAAFRAAERREAFKPRGSKAWLTARAAQGDRKEPPDDEAALSARLQRLGDRLATANRPSENGSGPRQTADRFGVSPAVSGCRPNWWPGVLVGAVIGWLLDRWLGISPWGLIVFLLLGFAAGVLNVMRAAGVVRERNLTTD